MQKKLTSTIDQHIVEQTKRYALKMHIPVNPDSYSGNKRPVNKIKKILEPSSHRYPF
jgi:hypothetical protein